MSTKITPEALIEMRETNPREYYKKEFTVIAKFMGIEPCNRCKDPYCVNNLPHYERWDNLMPVCKRIKAVINDKYPKEVFQLSTLTLYSKWIDALTSCVSFIEFDNQ